MIDEEATKRQFGYYSTDLKPESHKKIIAICDICGGARELRKDGYRDFCKRCATKRANTVEKIQCTCKQCGKPFESIPSRRNNGKSIFCSSKCHYEYGTKENSPNWKGGMIKRVCKLCGKVFFVFPSRIKIGEGIYCSYSCNMKDHLEEIRHKSKPPKTKPELIFEAICSKHNLPFRYVGDGQLWIGKKGGKQLNPDFIEAKGKKLIVEVFGDYWHSPLLNYRLLESATLQFKRKHFKTSRWKSTFIWERDLKRPDAEAFVLREVEKLLGVVRPIAASGQRTLSGFSTNDITETSNKRLK